MRHNSLLVLLLVLWCACNLLPARLHADPLPSAGRPAAERIRTALSRMQAWLGEGENGRRWNAYLKSEALAAELAKGGQADAEVVAAVLQAYAPAGAEGLDRAPLVAVRQALEAWLDELGIPQADQLPQLALAEKERFRPVTPRQLARARARLERRFSKLDAYLQAGGTKGQAWKKYLKWDELGRQLGQEGAPDIGSLVAVYRKLTEDHRGLELPQFARLTMALQKYIDLASVVQMPDLDKQYQRQLDALAAELARYVERPEETDRRQIGTRVGWLEGSGFAPLLVESIRRRISYPNYYFQASARLLNAGMHRVVDTRDQVVDSILGTSISGTAHTVGTVGVRLVPSTNHAVIETVLRARAVTDTVGRNGPVRIYSGGTTEIVATKQIIIDADGLRHRPTTSEATVHTETRGIAATRSGCLGRLIERAAWRRVGQSKSEAELIAARHAEARAERRVDAEATPQLAEANQRFLDQFRHPLLRRRQFPRQFRLQTSDSQLTLTLLQANRFQLGAPLPPPPVEGAPDLAVRIHETMVNNLASALLAGSTLTDDQLRQQLLETFGKLPDELQVDEDDEPWSITFARQGPLSVEFADGARVTITIRGQQFTSGDRRFRAMNITASYQVKRTETGTRLVRKEELEIVPPGFVPGKGRLSASQIALRRLLTKRLGDLFKREIVTDGLELPGEWKRVGKLPLIQMDIDRGWVALGWRLPARESVADRPDVGATR